MKFYWQGWGEIDLLFQYSMLTSANLHHTGYIKTWLRNKSNFMHLFTSIFRKQWRELYAAHALFASTDISQSTVLAKQTYNWGNRLRANPYSKSLWLSPAATHLAITHVLLHDRPLCRKMSYLWCQVWSKPCKRTQFLLHKRRNGKICSVNWEKAEYRLVRV